MCFHHCHHAVSLSFPLPSSAVPFFSVAPDEANLSDLDFAQVAFCAAEHAAFRDSGGTKLFNSDKVKIENLVKAEQVGAVVGVNGLEMVKEQVRNKLLKRELNSAADVVLAAIVGNATDGMLQAMLGGIVDLFPDVFSCSESFYLENRNTHDSADNLQLHLVGRAGKMLDLGEINLTSRFLQAVRTHSGTGHECFCNAILNLYVWQGAQEVFGNSLCKLSGSIFGPTRIWVGH